VAHDLAQGGDSLFQSYHLYRYTLHKVLQPLSQLTSLIGCSQGVIVGLAV
jgi:hypothetical protein